LNSAKTWSRNHGHEGDQVNSGKIIISGRSGRYPMAKSYSPGYHNIGDFHYFTALPEAAQWLGSRKEDTFETHDSFLSLITTVHETYHVMQELQSALCCWASIVRDDLAAAVLTRADKPFLSEALRGDDLAAAVLKKIIETEGKKPTVNIKAVSEEEAFVDKLINSSEVSRALLEAEIPPQFADSLPSLFELTGHDLLECHAAILTELYIAKLMKGQPDAFSRPIVDDMSVCFRVPLMSGYSRPLEIFRQLVGRGANFDTVNRQHPLYPHCQYGAEYSLLAFILDFALHVPSGHLAGEPDYYSRTSAVEDVVPVCRFIKMVFALPCCFLLTRQRGSLMNLDPGSLYSSLGKDLVQVINVSNMIARAQNLRSTRTLPSVSELVTLPRNKILKRLNLQECKDSFIGFDGTTSGWIDRYQRHKFNSVFTRIYSVRRKALRARSSDPGGFFTASSPDIIYGVTGLQGYYRTPRGTEMMPPWFTNEEVELDPPENVNGFVGNILKFLRSRKKGKTSTTVTTFAMSPYGFLPEVIAHETLLEVARMLYRHKPMQCPLTTDKLDFYPCPTRNASCNSIAELNQFPVGDCIARRTIEDVLPYL
jgi:hypothetical protein